MRLLIEFLEDSNKFYRHLIGIIYHYAVLHYITKMKLLLHKSYSIIAYFIFNMQRILL